MLSILNKFANARFVREPFTYLVIDDAYPDDLFSKFRASFPSLETVSGLTTFENNHLYLLGLSKIQRDGIPVPPHWLEFFRHHSSAQFFHEVFDLLGSDIRRVNPGLEPYFGKDLDELPVYIRDKKNQRADPSIALEIQFGINSPVIEKSSVRGAHVDSQYKLINALWYMREDDDDSMGGEFIIYRYKNGKPVFEGQKLNENDLVEVERIPYRPNRLLLFLNSAWSAHGVGPRSVTHHTRKYINFNIESYNIPNGELFSRPQKTSYKLSRLGKRILDRF